MLNQRFLAAFVLPLSLSLPLYASNLNQAQQQIQATEQAGQTSQRQVDKLDDQSMALFGQYRQAKAETEQLALYNRQMTQIVQNQENELESISKQIKEIERTERGILPLMSRMLDSLESFVALDTPFLIQERQARIALLKELLVRADVTVSEKFRRILEAYQIEVEYGRNIEAYRSKLDDVSYDFLRVGRTALYRLSNDGSQGWIWQGNKQWVALDNGYLRNLRQALKVAQQTTAPELLKLPLPTLASLQGAAQ